MVYGGEIDIFKIWESKLYAYILYVMNTLCIM
mgnify:CR=1 FL=1